MLLGIHLGRVIGLRFTRGLNNHVFAISVIVDFFDVIMKKNRPGHIAFFPLAATNPSTTPWWHDAVFYEVFVRSFYDSNADGIGDLKGLEKKLDYISRLGANAIWLMPIFTSPSYHGYDTVDYFRLNDDYGTLKDFESLVNQAAKKKIRIVLDLVLNHTSPQHPWFQKSVEKVAPYKDWYVWKKNKPRGKWFIWGSDKPVSGGGWYYNQRRKEFYFSFFSHDMPELNMQNPRVREETKKIAKFWLDKGVAGFRLDAARHIIVEGPGKAKQFNTPATIKWWVEFAKFVKSINPAAVLIGEVWSGHSDISKYYANGKGLDFCFDFPWQSAAIETISRGDARIFVDMVKRKKQTSAPLYFFAPFLSNHDQSRYLTSLKKNLHKARIATLLLFTSPGPPFIYYGEEIGMHHGTRKKTDLPVRTPMQWDNTKITAGFTDAKKPWHKINYNNATYNVACQQRSSDSILKFYQKLINLRLKLPELRYGRYRFHSIGKNILVYQRIYKKRSVLILINLSNKKQTFNYRAIRGRYKNLLTGRKIKIADGFVMPVGQFLLLKPL